MIMVRRVVPSVIYGPIKSRRFGRSLGINLSGQGKYCSFNCAYCFRGFNEGKSMPPEYIAELPSPERVLDELDGWFRKNSGTQIDDITFAGNGEPTDHPEFSNIARRVMAYKTAEQPELKVSVLTNGMGLVSRLCPNADAVARSLMAVDRPCIKFDSADPTTWKKLANPLDGVCYDEWQQSLNRVVRPTVQIMLVQGRIDNTTNREIRLLIQEVKRLGPESVQLVTLSREPADGGLKPVSQDKMESIQAVIDHEFMRRS